MPCPPPLFDHLQYANTEGESLGDLVMCVMSDRGWRQRPTKNLKALPCIVHTGTGGWSIHKAASILLI